MSELDDIRRQYESGHLDSIKEDLGRFICAHRSLISDYRMTAAWLTGKLDRELAEAGVPLE